MDVVKCIWLCGNLKVMMEMNGVLGKVWKCILYGLSGCKYDSMKWLKMDEMYANR